MMKYLIVLFITCCSYLAFAQGPNWIVDEVKDSIKPTKVIGEGFSYENPQKYELGPIRIDGADNFDAQAIKLIAGLRPGQEITLPGEEITKAIKNLWDEGLFSSVSIEVEKEVAGVVYLVIKLTPRPKLSRFKFRGINRREADKVREEIDLASGKTITENLVFTTRNKVKGYFREKGYHNVQVNINRIKDTLINNSEIFLIEINKGQKVRIKKINITGTSSVPMWKLRKSMKDTKQMAVWRVFKRSKFSESAYERDKVALVEKLRSVVLRDVTIIRDSVYSIDKRHLMIDIEILEGNKYYFGDKVALVEKLRSVGLRDVTIIRDSVYSIDKRHLMIDIEILEGNKYYFGDMSWIGNTKFSSGLLDTVLGIDYGDIYNKPLLDQRQ